jgi:hypothetical protein
MFTDYQGKEDGYVLKPDVTLDFVSAAERIAANPKLWRKEMGRVCMTSMAEAIGILTQQDPERTRSARLKLLSEADRSSDPATILRHLVYTFGADQDKKALREIVHDPKLVGTYLQDQAKKILEAYYENVAWA